MARIYRTEDGRHVPEGDLDAAVLAFGEDDQVPDEVLAELGVPAQKPVEPVESVDPASVGAEADDPPAEQPADPAEKQASAPANKARRGAANKAGA